MSTHKIFRTNLHEFKLEYATAKLARRITQYRKHWYASMTVLKSQNISMHCMSSGFDQSRCSASPTECDRQFDRLHQYHSKSLSSSVYNGILLVPSLHHFYRDWEITNKPSIAIYLSTRRCYYGLGMYVCNNYIRNQTLNGIPSSSLWNIFSWHRICDSIQK